MKKRLGILLSVAAAVLAATATLLPATPGVAQRAGVRGDDEEPKEFYFTRLIYSGGGGGGGRGGRGGGGGGGGGRNNVAGLDDKNICADADSMAAHHQRGGSWATDYPEADCKFMWGVERMTNTRIHKEPHAIRIMDDKLFDYPFIYSVEMGRGMQLSDEEAKRLREYLDRGGFWWCDDFWGLREWDNYADNLAKIFPEHVADLADPNKSALEIGPKHEAFHTFFDIDTVMQIPNISNGIRYFRTNGQADTSEQGGVDARVFAISDKKGRMQVLITHNSDLGDAWEHMDNPEYPEKFSGQAYRMGMNFIIFGMTH